MCRKARVKLENGIYHVILRSMSEFSLYKNNKDKDKFLSIVKKYQIKFKFKVYAYCLMTTHSHLLIDSNGADISKFMHDINQSYAQYYNRKYNRKGHVFLERFKSKLINSDNYLLTVSAYIHRNPKNIKKYKDCIETYKHSSLGVYLGLAKDPFNILDEDFIMHMFSNDVKKARQLYSEFVYKCNDRIFKKVAEFENEKTEYKSERYIIKRRFSPKEILDFTSKYTNTPKWKLLLKNNRTSTKAKALYILMLKCLCNFRDKDICKIIGNITQSRISSLCSLGINIVLTNSKYRNIIDDFIVLTNS